MDSGNSAPSSSGADDAVGDDAFDSRTLFVNSSTNFLQTPLQLPPNSFNTTSFTQTLNPDNNPMYNLDSLWTRNTNPSTNPNSNPNQNTIYNLDAHQDLIYNTNTVESDALKAKNPKKRTRASRRAPTTVLTTDTTNFRQMVQEFTGIPAAPFAATSSSSQFPRRIDLYAGGMQSLRPSYISTNTSTSFHLPPSEIQGFPKQPLNLQNLQNQIFPFQGLSQSVVNPQVNVTERGNERVDGSNAFASSSSKRWRGEGENLVNFDRANVNNEKSVVSTRNDGDQLPGNEDSWIFPSD